MKKITAAALCLVMVVLCLVPAWAGTEVKGEITDYPVVVVPGFSAAWLRYDDGTEEGVCAWNGLNFDAVLPNLLSRILELGAGLAVMNLDNAKYLASVLAEELERAWPYVGCNPDGSSTYPMDVYYFDPAVTNTAYMDANDIGFGFHDVENADIIADYIGTENIYNFNVDWRMGSEFCANKLNDYIKGVKELTGKDKVNVIATSQGGQITATYLTLFGEQNDVDNAVLSSPATCGTTLAADLLSRTVSAQEVGLMQIIEHGMWMDEDYEWLLRAEKLGFLDDILNSLIPHLADSVGYWGAVWDLVPTEKYEALKQQYLSAPASAPLVAQSDRFHYEIQPKFADTFRTCRENGMNISIIAGTNVGVFSSGTTEADGVIDVATATGATVAPWGSRFTDGYVQKNSCGGSYKLSPGRTIDASTAFLPDNTWFVEGIYHGWSWFSYTTRPLAITLLLTDRITDVYSDPDFPQFMVSDNCSKGVCFSFNNAPVGYLNGQSDTLTVKNVCEKSDMRILGIYCDNLDLKFKVDRSVKLAPGETLTVPVTGTVPQEAGRCIHITVCFAMGNITPLSYKTNAFTLMNGEFVQGESGIQPIEQTTPFEKAMPEFLLKIFQWFGFREWFAMLSVLVVSLF